MPSPLAPPESPPHARGRELDSFGRVEDQGITPACAGKRPSCRRCTRYSRNHPRVRGEESLTVMVTVAFLESPPRARGRGNNNYHALPICGITPACAGKRHERRGSVRHIRNHPRVRGEEWSCSSRRCPAPESPPRARGRATFDPTCCDRNGITPACAGKRACGGRRAEPVWNHPRVRGEEDVGVLRDSVVVESPPRARGRAVSDADAIFLSGITPACAGKSWGEDDGCRTGGNHPRVRGEEHAVAVSDADRKESPPRARGRVENHRRPCVRAGNHPRVRGEESNENAALGDIAIPPKCRFFALFQEPPSSAA